MKTKTIFSKPVNRGITIAIGFIFLLAMVGCGGGGGGEQVSTARNVTISGKVDDGTPNSPIPDASCRFIGRDGTVYSTSTTDANGRYSVEVPAGLEGHIVCTPQRLANLSLYTFSSSRGTSPGQSISDENINPSTTVIADIIKHENPADCKSRKTQLLASIAGDTDLSAIVNLTTALFNTMYQYRTDVTLGDSSPGGGDGGGGSSGDGSGASGAAGDGGDASPIVNAPCEFIIGSILQQGQKLYKSPLADFYNYGHLNRPDLETIRDIVANAIANSTNKSESEILEAFSRVFHQGAWDNYTTRTGADGSYFLRIPANVPGFVSCTAPNQDQLVLVTYVKALNAGERLPNQDVNPATTIFSNNIASKLAKTDNIWGAKENFLDDISGLGLVHVDLSSLTPFTLNGTPSDEGVGMAAFTATSLFNILYKNSINGDFLAILDDLGQKRTVDPTTLSSQGLAAAQITSVTNSVNQASQQLVDLNSAFQTARVQVLVVDNALQGSSIISATVNITSKPDTVTCVNADPNDVTCHPLQTGGINPVTFTLRGVPSDPVSITIQANDGHSAPVSRNVSVVAFATIGLEIPIDPTFGLQVQVSGAGGYVTSSPAGIDCGTHPDGQQASNCSAAIDAGTQVTLSASALSGRRFAGWSGEGCSGTGVCIVTLNQGRSVSANFVYDHIGAPVVQISSPTTSGSYRTNLQTLNISGSASDEIGVAQVTWINSMGGSGTCAGTTSWSAGIILGGGTNVITITATDAAGNSGTATLTVIADLLRPNVTIVSPTVNPTYLTNTTSLNISGSAADDVGVTQVSWSNNRGGSGTCTGTTSWGYNGITLYSGTNVITVTAADSYGTGTDTLTVIQNDYPVVTITSPTSNPSYLALTSTLNIAGNASDAVGGVTQVTWTNSRGGSGTCNGTTSWSANGITLYPGNANVITVTATDAYGSIANKTLTVTLDDRPVVIITSPSSSPTNSQSNVLNISGTASDNVGTVTQVAWANNRGGGGICTGTNSWSRTGIPLLYGTNVITITATDSYGLTGTATITVNYVIPPVLSNPRLTGSTPNHPSCALYGPPYGTRYNVTFDYTDANGDVDYSSLNVDYIFSGGYQGSNDCQAGYVISGTTTSGTYTSYQCYREAGLWVDVTMTLKDNYLLTSNPITYRISFPQY